MKKFFVAMAFALPLVFASCEKNDEPNVLPDGMSINVYETGDLEVAGNWTSSNEFVATVDKKGKVTTHHVGEAVLTLVDGTQTTSCTITVNPVNTSYTFPSFAWGSDVNAVKSYCSVLTLFEEYTDEEKAQVKEIFQKVADLNTILDKYDIEVKFDWEEYFTLLGQIYITPGCY